MPTQEQGNQGLVPHTSSYLSKREIVGAAQIGAEAGVAAKATSGMDIIDHVVEIGLDAGSGGAITACRVLYEEVLSEPKDERSRQDDEKRKA